MTERPGDYPGKVPLGDLLKARGSTHAVACGLVQSR